MKRIYVHRSRYEEFTKLFAQNIDQIVVGEGVTMGPLISRDSVGRVRRIVEDVVASGGTAQKLGRIDNQEIFENGYFMRPTLVTGAPQSSTLAQEEQFGPAIPILPFDLDEAAVTLANDTSYGLCASVWSSNEERAVSVAERIQAGQVFINNNYMAVDLRAPLGGMKQSGLGREMGLMGIQAYTEPHVRILKTGVPRSRKDA